MSDFFNDLMTSVNEAVAISEGKATAARITRYEMPDVKAIRALSGLKQDDFASALGVSPSLVQAWEQHRRQPTGTALKVLNILKNQPDFINELKAI
ncbi:helix-turn-helix domain-containing protein [Brenneria goodwinii]|uniref:NadS family protein n=1 Tax=Brenneria goodwinii TaxID=1109412 RepID=UPI000EF1E4B5|nr:NadS family protein [Brenneria goodwinii]MCG8157002.1 helix-turn-helix domain-containing protein [Brenneria goodwinii]MCG8161353.1 helix-turn-helix domain-containing protein [Brenneria goodwinii]MCG8168054.1 helix-turn-helix domain-containing protein [Brenneria goodwinii]MCG8172730.1 helix-turn-helix domain-containing protein [Brenneria goodwinii]MCG8175532.1 helix-turn-helix domain-containing protein [Brenneria goodwinii]